MSPRSPALLVVLLRCGAATADNVREVVKLPPADQSEVLRVCPGLLAKLELFGKSVSPRHAARRALSPRGRLELVDRDAALMWLADHPDTPERPA